MPDADLLAWANAQPRSGSFSVSPSITTEGVPAVAWYMGYLEVSASGRRMTITDSSNQFLTWTNITSSSQWTGWKPLATATPPQEFNLPLAEGWLPIDARYGAVYWKTQESIVNISLSLKSDHTVTDGEIIATLPSGFRPKKSLKIPITVVNQNELLVHGYVDINRSDGTIQLYKITGQINELCFPTTNFLANG